ncbi:MAG TPA: Fic family protein [Bacilli bacterium]|nr:Fic family protein [Bacilli bacterium]
MDTINQEKIILPLPLADKRQMTICKDCFNELKAELELFLDENPYLQTKEFLTSALFRLELKANNAVEGITDDIRLIEQVIADAASINDINRRNRIKNLYNGYRYILQGYQINKETLRQLYQILSKDLLEPEDEQRMGPYYREAPVFILRNGRLDDSYDMGLDESVLEYFMDQYFTFVNTNNDLATSTDYFIKSQIMHYYFVYIHPYFDINGRTSRTLAMWYLLNENAYPYIIFNRAISLDASYDRIIRDIKNQGKIDNFINYMMVNTKKELEKEYIMHSIAEYHKDLSSLDFQTLEYLLSLRGNVTVLDFCSIYSRFNDKKKVKEIYETMLDPLIQKAIVNIKRDTQKTMYGSYPNQVLTLNKQLIPNPQYIKRLNI